MASPFLFVFLFVSFFGCIYMQSWMQQHHNVCLRNYRCVAGCYPDESPTPLRDAALQAKQLKVVIKYGTKQESFDVDNVNMNGNVICAEVVNRMSVPVDQQLKRQPMIVCNNNYVSQLSMAANLREDTTNIVEQILPATNIIFYARDISPNSEPLRSYYLDGTSKDFGSSLFDFATTSQIYGVMRDRGYSFRMDNVQIKSGQVNGQSLNHISQSFTQTGGIKFRQSPYYWYSNWESSGRRDSARYTLGLMEKLRHTNDFVALDWYADSCWKLVYFHDKTGKPLVGSVETLMMYVKMGHRVRVHYNSTTVEADAIILDPEGIVVAQTTSEMARRGGSKSDKTFFNYKVRSVYSIVATTGKIRSYKYFLATGQLSESVHGDLPVMWSVDTRPWRKVLEMNSTNDQIFGSKQTVVNGYRESYRISYEFDAGLKYKHIYGDKNPEYFLQTHGVVRLDNTADSELVTQSIGVLHMYRESPSKQEYALTLYQPYTIYTQVSTKTGVSRAGFNLKTLFYKEPETLDIPVLRWFRSDAVYPD